MKKQYMSPSVDNVIVGVKTAILTGSNVVRYGEDNGGEATSTDPNLSRRRRTVWDDEEEDEEETFR